jgi:hypothetical protein
MTPPYILCPSCAHCTGIASQQDKDISDITDILFIICNATTFSIRNLATKCPYFEMKNPDENKDEIL